MPLSFSSGLVFAYTTITSALGPLVIHIFDPLRMYLLPFFSARSFIAVTSEPAPGSDMARAPTHYPLHSFGRYFCFCASVPCLAICPRQRAVCAPQERPIEPLAREISSMIMEWAVQERSEPPYWEGTVDPRSPISPNYFQRCSGKLSSLSTFWARGAMRSSANLRTVAWRAAVSESKPAIWRKLVVENLRRELVSRRIIILLNRNARHYKRQQKATPAYLGSGGEGVWQMKGR